MPALTNGEEVRFALDVVGGATGSSVARSQYLLRMAVFELHSVSGRLGRFYGDWNRTTGP